MATEEEWIAIATIATGSLVSIAAVCLGYWFQIRTSKRERLLEVAAQTISDFSSFLFIAKAKVDLNGARLEIDGWSDVPPSESLEEVRSKIAGASMLMGGTFLGASGGEVRPVTNKSDVVKWWIDVIATWSRTFADRRKRLELDGVTFDLLRPELKLGQRLDGLAHDFSEEIKVCASVEDLNKMFDSRVGEFKTAVTAALK